MKWIPYIIPFSDEEHETHRDELAQAYTARQWQHRDLDRDHPAANWHLFNSYAYETDRQRKAGEHFQVEAAEHAETYRL